MTERARQLLTKATRALPNHPWSWVVLASCAFGAFLRFLNAHGDLSTPHRDENDVVVQAVAFMGRDHEYHLLEYGPLTMYLLAALYRLVALARGMTAVAYAARVIFDYQEHYLIARLFCAACCLVLAYAVHRVLSPRFGRVAAGVSAILLSLPCVDILTYSRVRIDVVQGAFQIGTLLALMVAMESGKLRHWVIAGFLAGCAIASKPLPGLLVLPCFLLASWFAAGGTPGAQPERTGAGGARFRRLVRRGRAAVLRPGLGCSVLAALFAALLGNPTSMQIGRFITAQRQAFAFYSGDGAPGLNENVLQGFAPLGYGFLAAALLGLFAVLWWSDTRAKLIAAFALIYAAAFLGRPVRHYYLVAPAMASCLVIGIGIGALLERGRSSARGLRFWWLLEPALALAIIACAALSPLLRLDEIRHWISNPTRANQWILSHIPSGTKIFQFGNFNDGPHLVSTNADQQERFGDYFEYGRTHYAFLKKAFRLAYERYKADGRPLYRIEATPVTPVLANKQKPRWLARSLDQHARENHQEYIVLAGFSGATDPFKLGYPWLRSVELVQQFEWIAILRVLPATVVEATSDTALKPAVVQGAAATIP